MAPEAEGYWQKAAEDREALLLKIAALVGNPPIEDLPEIIRRELAVVSDQESLATGLAALQSAIAGEGA